MLSRLLNRKILLPTYIKNLCFSGYSSYKFNSPPFCNYQVLFSKKSRRRITYQVNSIVHLKTAIQIFADEEYGDKNCRINNIYSFILKSGKTPLIFDIGANIGLAALYFKDQYSLSTIYCVEPDQENFNILTYNISQYPDVIPIKAGLSGQDGVGFISNPSSSSWSRKVSHMDTLSSVTNSQSTFPLSTLDTLVSTHSNFVPGGSPFILKVDIEGAESDVFATPSQWLDQFPVIFIEIHDFMFPGEAKSLPVIKALSTLNRDFIISGENILSISNCIQ